MVKFCSLEASYSDFPKISVDDAVRSCSLFIPDAGIEQVRVWKQTIPVVQQEILKDSSFLGEYASSNHVILEYQLPREGGRRPDFILLRNGEVIVIECKQAGEVRREDLDQVLAYARDLSNYHSKSHGVNVIPVLALSDYQENNSEIDGVYVISQKKLADLLKEITKEKFLNSINCAEWLQAEYEPLPGLVEAARRIFKNEPLPQIKRARAARIPDSVNYIFSQIEEAKQKNKRKLILLSGVPGAGKTLVGLQLVHDSRLQGLRISAKGHAVATFLSGNAPLVRVLQDALGRNTLVSDMKKFINEYAIKRKNLIPPNNVIVFDEAQRAWDQDYFFKKHHTSMSEPEALLDIMERTEGWGVIVGLVGEGQEIHSGEESGIGNWIDSIVRTKRSSIWETYGSVKVAEEFLSHGVKSNGSDLLNLDTSLRSHLASKLHDWVAGVVGSREVSPQELSIEAKALRSQGFCIYLTQDLNAAREYLRNRYEGLPQKKFGLLASRYARNLLKLGIDNQFHFERVKQLDAAQWFNAPLGDSNSCTSLLRPATEFEAQGLEVELPVITWGDDFIRKDGNWTLRKRFGQRVEYPLEVRKNAYRVLLTRGRDGLIFFVPKDENLKETFQFLNQAGARLL